MERLFRHRRLLAVLLLALCVLIALPRLSRMTVEDILAYTPASPLLAALVLLTIYCVKSVVMVIPIAVLYLAAGILFPPVPAMLITYLGIVCEAAIGYYFGKKLGREAVLRMMKQNKTMDKLMAFQARNRTVTCFLSRILPFPFDLVSMFFGASAAPFFGYLACSLLGISPFMAPFVIAGNAVGDPLSKEFLIPFAISLSLTACVFFVLRRLQKRR